MPERYPFGLDAEAVLKLTSAAWRSHDGQWFLKARDKVGLEGAMDLNHRAMSSLARIELRNIKVAAGIDDIDTLDDVAEVYRLVPITFGGGLVFGQTQTQLDDDTMVVENEQCLGSVVAERSGYGHLSAGTYPQCGGFLNRQRAWGEAMSGTYRYSVERCPEEGRPCRYVVSRQRRDAPG